MLGPATEVGYGVLAGLLLDSVPDGAGPGTGTGPGLEPEGAGPGLEPDGAGLEPDAGTVFEAIGSG